MSAKSLGAFASNDSLLDVSSDLSPQKKDLGEKKDSNQSSL
jgi:hypothetical protein